MSKGNGKVWARITPPPGFVGQIPDENGRIPPGVEIWTDTKDGVDQRAYASGVVVGLCLVAALVVLLNALL